MDDAIKFEVYEDKSGQYRWRAVASNGRVVADSSESYTRRTDAKRARDRFIEMVKAL